MNCVTSGLTRSHLALSCTRKRKALAPSGRQAAHAPAAGSTASAFHIGRVARAALSPGTMRSKGGEGGRPWTSIMRRAVNTEPVDSSRFVNAAERREGGEARQGTGTVTYNEALFNSVNILLGVGLLTVPYALNEGGWASLGVLALLWNVTRYTGKLLARCQSPDRCADPYENMDPDNTLAAPAKWCEGLETYEDIGEAAFGSWGRKFITTILYTELLGTCGLFFILEGDHLQLLTGGQGGLSHEQLMCLSALVFIPTTWLKDLSSLSYVGLFGGVSTAALAGVILWNFVMGGYISEPAETAVLHLSTLPNTFGILAFVFAGHAVFPSISASMEEPERFPEMLDRTYTIVGAACVVVGVTGYLMYGPGVLEEVTLNLPKGALSTVATCLILVSPLTKFALTLDPVARGLERRLGLDINGAGLDPLLARVSRTTLGVGTLVGAASLPFFGIMMSLLGSFLTLVVSVIFPSLCYLKLFDGKMSDNERYLNYFVVALGVFCACSGTWTAIDGIMSGKAGGM